MPASQVPQEANQEQVAKQEEAKQAQANEEQSAESSPLHRHPTLLAMLRRNNEIRRRLGLPPHRINPALTKAAQDHANYMARTGDFQHYSNGGPQGRAFKYGFRGSVRENIAYNYRTVEDAFSVWQGSSGHYASIVSGTTEAGFGYAVSASGAVYYVGVYGNAADGDEVGEDEETAFKLAAAEAGQQTADPIPTEVVADPKVVQAANQATTLGQQPASQAGAQDNTSTQAATQSSGSNYSRPRRGFFGRRR
jgi:uncharacterized protein YkwD